MSRARTKIAEWWETSFDRSNPLREVPKRTKQGARAVARVNGGKVFHVTRYRLEPLAKLRWVQSKDGFLDATDGKVCRASVKPSDECAGEWWARVWKDEFPMYAATIDEAKAACSARLLELGYRVVDEKGGAR